MISALDSGGSGPADVLVALAPYTEILSLVLVLGSLAIITYLALRTKTFRSFQFEMFLFMLVLGVAEVPRILETLGLIAATPYYDQIGLEVHSVSMAILTAFVALRVYGFRRGRAK
jgi:predicted membrane channel-forming protein YqfA (hemolysin III family)